MTGPLPVHIAQRDGGWLINIVLNTTSLTGVILAARRLPTQLSWNQIFAMALLAACLGGLLWLVTFRIGRRSGFFGDVDEPSGGTKFEERRVAGPPNAAAEDEAPAVAPGAGGAAVSEREPRAGGPKPRSGEPKAFESIAWVLSNLGGPMLVAWWVNTRLPGRPFYPGLAYLACVAGFAVGATVFYGLGLREVILGKLHGYESQEFLLVALWSLLLTGFGFAGFDLVSAHAGAPGLPSSILSWVVRTATCTLVTTCVVTCYVLFDPRRTAATEGIRGLIAALTLILSVFFASIVTSFEEALSIFS
jgi:hypothetical protein